MTLGELKYILCQLEDKELSRPALFHDVYFGRSIPVMGVDTVDALGMSGDDIVLVGNREHAK